MTTATITAKVFTNCYVWIDCDMVRHAAPVWTKYASSCWNEPERNYVRQEIAKRFGVLVDDSLGKINANYFDLESWGSGESSIVHAAK